ncbi:MAG: hypothetical protein AB1721_00160 [Patescibacteria group bacterium]
MDKPNFQVSFLGNKTEIFKDKIIYQALWGILGEVSIPLKEISSVKLAAIWTPEVLIETSGGQKYSLFTPWLLKKRLKQEIEKAQKT